MKTAIKVILLLVLFVIPATAQLNRANIRKIVPKVSQPHWNWIPVWQDADGKPNVYVDADSILRIDQRVTYQVKMIDVNGVDVVLVAMSNCIRGSVTFAPTFVIGADGVPVATERPTTAAEVDDSLIHFEPDDQGKVWKYLVVYACKNAKSF